MHSNLYLLTMIIVLFLIFHWYSSLFCQTFFHHRYSAHAMFSMSKFWEKVFYIFSFIFQGSSYLSPYAYGILHRMHHAYADTEKDPHSPKYDSNIFKMMWKTKNIYNGIYRNQITIEEKFKKNLPKWTAFDKFGDSWFSRATWGIIYIIFYAFFATQWWMYLLLPIHFVMGPFHGAVINWFAHKIGYRNYEIDDTSKNIMPVDILMLGEGYHNNHHMYSTRPNFGIKWHEIDPVYPFIRIFKALRIIRFA